MTLTVPYTSDVIYRKKLKPCSRPDIDYAPNCGVQANAVVFQGVALSEITSKE
jgi:hypothetical protein